METIDETAITNHAPLPNQRDCRGRLEARRISHSRCQRTATEGTLNSEYTLSEVVEIGKAQDVILGGKIDTAADDGSFLRVPSDYFDE